MTKFARTYGSVPIILLFIVLLSTSCIAGVGNSSSIVLQQSAATPESVSAPGTQQIIVYQVPAGYTLVPTTETAKAPVKSEFNPWVFWSIEVNLLKPSSTGNDNIYVRQRTSPYNSDSFTSNYNANCNLSLNAKARVAAGGFTSPDNTPIGNLIAEWYDGTGCFFQYDCYRAAANNINVATYSPVPTGIASFNNTTNVFGFGCSIDLFKPEKHKYAYVFAELSVISSNTNYTFLATDGSGNSYSGSGNNTQFNGLIGISGEIPLIKDTLSAYGDFATGVPWVSTAYDCDLGLRVSPFKNVSLQAGYRFVGWTIDDYTSGSIGNVTITDNSYSRYFNGFYGGLSYAFI